ncbi:hypothetical protein PCANC_09244 [Puccinia coronata f. sp. avenae]|uniref:Uncharacterized protein n=1 Tax=Puccinia coronata f. sp. avenae TaxID=200324 RepID=A0A2N5RZ46_9BASI|nr:hypothetical protein PCASD_23805 [Puccinia coronata f. sp. avenae]PLW19869.1 hypothetical protein PCANC_09244 [Puccinia coronata f. sp. avenae]PLW31216.1 hypothetical protein PCASD_11069 [Puccinia coronata f. sp. avenae]
MEGLLVKSASLANRLEETRVGESARGGYVEATENLEKVEGPGFTSRPVMEELHHTNQAPVKPIGEVTARGFVNQALKRFKDTIFKFAQKIRKFFFQSNAEIFDGIGIFKKYPELLPLARESESLDEEIEKFMTKILNHPRTRIINLPLFEKEKAKLKQSFRNLHNVLKKSQEAANINFAPYEEISKELGRIPLPKYEKLSPTQALGRMMATYQSKALAEDQESQLISIFLASSLS